MGSKEMDTSIPGALAQISESVARVMVGTLTGSPDLIAHSTRIAHQIMILSANGLIDLSGLSPRDRAAAINVTNIVSDWDDEDESIGDFVKRLSPEQGEIVTRDAPIWTRAIWPRLPLQPKDRMLVLGAAALPPSKPLAEKPPTGSNLIKSTGNSLDNCLNEIESAVLSDENATLPASDITGGIFDSIMSGEPPLSEFLEEVSPKTKVNIRAILLKHGYDPDNHE